jgi:hypothetical protein
LLPRKPKERFSPGLAATFQRPGAERLYSAACRKSRPHTATLLPDELKRDLIDRDNDSFG